MSNIDYEHSDIADFSKPEEPKEEDCCHSGCENCVFDVYLRALENWKSCRQIVSRKLRYDLLSVTKFKPFILVGIKNISCDTFLYTFKPCVEDVSSLHGFLPYNSGQYLSLKVDTCLLTLTDLGKKQEGSYLIRDFTIISLSQKRFDCSFEVLIKLYQRSHTSNYIKSLQVNDKTLWRGPYGEFKYVPNKYSHLIMFCMGTGIAPMYPIINEIVNNEADETVISLHFGCRNSSEIILRNEIKELTYFWNFNCIYYLSEEKDLRNKKYSENFVLNKISQEHVQEALHNKHNLFVLICGSKSFNNDIESALKTCSIDKDRYYTF